MKIKCNLHTKLNKKLNFLINKKPRDLTPVIFSKMKLKFSSVQQPELVGYLALLNPQIVEVEEVVGYCDAVTKNK